MMAVDFGPFQRPDPLPADNGPGTGHLLVLARQMAEMILVFMRFDELSGHTNIS
jgi:hypothetical protein